MPPASANSPATTPRPLRLLIAEDSPADAELIVAVLKRAGYALSFDIVDSPQLFQQRLQDGEYSLILSDHNLRSWTGMDALELVRESKKDIPFIVATGTLGDETAVEYIKRGAADYILKHRMEQLPVAVGQVLRERAQREETRRLQEEILSAKRDWELTFDAVPDAIFLLSDQCKILRANRAATETLGLAFSDIVGKTCDEVVHGNQEAPSCPHVQLRAAGQPASAEMREQRLGKLFYVTTSPIRDAAGGGSGCVHVMRDITEQRQAEAAQRRAETRYWKLFEDVPVGLFRAAPDGRILDVNRHLVQMLGYPDAATLMSTRAETLYVHAEDRHKFLAEMEKTGVSQGSEVEYRRYDGTLIWVRRNARAGRGPGGAITYYEGSAEDITEQKRAVEALRKSEERFQLATRATNDAVWDWDLATNLMWWNDGVSNLFGYPAEAVKPDATWRDRNIHEDDRNRVVESVHTVMESQDQFWWSEYRFRRADGTYAQVLDKGYVMRDPQGKAVRMIGAMADLTERKQLEDQLRQAQKMEAIGRLAGGVAHDFNNMLGVIMGYSEVLSTLVAKDDAKLQKYCAEIIRAGQRAAGLTRQLVAFSRQQALEPRVLSLNSIVLEAENMLKRLMGEDIEVETTLAADLWRTKVDAGQMHQILLNLAANARDAMPKGGKFFIRTSNATLDDAYSHLHPLVAPGQYVLLAVTDSGAGMDEETKTRIFEPFFTTKELGRGTGLGLATVYGIVKQSGGFIWVYSEPGHGTTFKIYLLRTEEEALINVATPGAAQASGTETILLVEDEEALRRITWQLLEQGGYRVLSAEDSDRALELAKEHAGPIDLLLTDVVMPGLSGPQLAKQVAELRPEVKVLFVSGYADRAFAHHGVAAGMALLEKPYSGANLLRTVREVLGG